MTFNGRYRSGGGGGSAKVRRLFMFDTAQRDSGNTELGIRHSSGRLSPSWQTIIFSLPIMPARHPIFEEKPHAEIVSSNRCVARRHL